jgi:hypothetical protein
VSKKGKSLYYQAKMLAQLRLLSYIMESGVDIFLSFLLEIAHQMLIGAETK